ncbi:hypothetical protein GCM10009096_11020 [Parasphingorhabdus litoris]|uniref:Peptidase inhibitor I78 family protein n=1 Tax=Parasphingorhabdus litoris TaxID=394733 RepID=A0ABN1AAN2_9SPHN|nr:I78 family peptidase inhibitor [Parasphingorhabdus litoris]
MKNRYVLVAICCTALAACSTNGSEPEIPERGITPGFVCKADGLTIYVGQRANAQTGASALKKSGAKTLRWIAPRSAVSMDFRQDRLNIEYDDAMVITRINCG